MLTIFSWNIRQGGGTRVSKINSAITKNGAEIVVLSEFKNNTAGQTIRTNLLRNGYLHQVVSAAPSNINSVLIASKLPFSSRLHHTGIQDFPNNIISAKFNAFEVYGMYLPHKKKHTLFSYLIDQLKMGGPSVLCGDFNTGYNYIDQKGNSFWYSDELDNLKENDYQDAFRHFHPEQKEFSWYSHQGNGYRYDHIWTQKDLLPVLKDCWYDHDVRTENISDHSAQILEFLV